MMAAWFIYLSKCSVCLCVLYAFCKCLCAGSTLFGFHRKLMLWGLAVSLCLPLVQWTTEKETKAQSPLLMWSEMLSEAWQEMPVAVEGQMETVDIRLEEKDGAWIRNLLPWSYWAGALAVFLSYGLCYIRLWRLLRRGERVRGQGWTGILTDEPVEPFSVGRFVVMSSEDYRAFPLICLHEQMHVRFRHTWDEVLMQALTVLFWFHPLVWLLRRDLREQHEFQADEGVLQQGIDAKTYQILLVRKSVGAKRFAMASGFCHCSLKKRVTMMLKKRTNGWRRIGLLLVLPLVGGTAWLFARPEMNVSQQQERVAAKETAVATLADTVRCERRYAEMKDGPEVFDVKINWKSEVLLTDDVHLKKKKRGAASLVEVEQVATQMLMEKFRKMVDSDKDVHPVIRIQASTQTPEESVEKLEQALREAVRKAVAELSLSCPADRMQKFLEVNWAYQKPKNIPRNRKN